jgi:glycosyltransferase involved in cell wall biosynthesis
MYKISILTVTYNSERHLEQTIESVVGQTYPHIEFIVVDGGSTDGTLGIIERYADRMHHHVSEPDEGIADAMNKGLSLATGDYIYFLHSDDYLENDESIAQAAEYCAAGLEILLFSIYLEKGGTKTLRKPRGLGPWLNLKTGVYHQSAICAASLFERIGGFDTEFDVTMDYDFFLRAYRQGIRARVVDLPIATMRLVGISSQTDWGSLRHRFAEERKVHEKNCPSAGMRMFYAAYWSLYLPYRRLRHGLAG